MARTISVDIAGGSSCGASPTISHHDSDGGSSIRVTVSMPATVLPDAAMMASALLLDFVENNQGGGGGGSEESIAAVERVNISDLEFMGGSAEALTTFLILHAHSVRHVSLHNITDSCSDASKPTLEALAALVQSFQTASLLETIDLSRNEIDSEVWEAFVPYSAAVRKFVLDGVSLDGESMRTLARANIVRTIEQFHLTLSRLVESGEMEASANELLQQFTRLRTLRWVNQCGDNHASEQQAGTIPWSALARAAKRNQSTLETLIVGGGHATERDVGLLCSTLGELHRLTNLKLQGLDLDDQCLREVVATLIHNRLSLSCLDLSHNWIQSEGSSALLELLSSPQVMESLKSLCLENNHLDASSLSKIITTVSNLYSSEFRLQCDNNATDMGPVACELALKRKAAETERDAVSRELARAKSQLKEAQYHLREISAAQTTILADYQKLKKENRELKEDRDTLIRAFEILGNAKQVEAQARLLARVSRIEGKLFGEEEPLRSPTRKGLSEFMAVEAGDRSGDEEARSRSSSYDEGSVSRPGGRRHPVPRSRSNESVVSMSMERRKRELKRSSMDMAHHGSTTTATTLNSSRSTLFSASVQSFEDMSNSLTTLALTPSPRRRLPTRGASERWARSPAVVVGSPDRVPKSPSLHLSHHSFRHGHDSNRSLKSNDIAEGNEDEVSLDPNDMVVRDRSHSISRQ
jgi:Ran GTPase-activating protein (RanGAP) involved in mRNA processing and transport